MKLRHALWIAPLFLLGCAQRATEEDCDKFADKFIDMMSADENGKPDPTVRKMLEGDYESLKEKCMKEGTKKEVDCVLSKNTMEEVEADCQ